jgi:hypothetical protein
MSAFGHAGARAPEVCRAHREGVSGQQTLHDCVARIGATFHELVAYQPASRYWTLHWLELAIYLAAAIILGSACFLLVRRRAV